jgi:hypothetical protein
MSTLADRPPRHRPPPAASTHTMHDRVSKLIVHGKQSPATRVRECGRVGVAVERKRTMEAERDLRL